METNAHLQNGAALPFSGPLSGADVLLWGALPHLHLNIAQTASLCGISVRQLGYWTKQGYVTASGHGARRMYGLDALRRVLAIKDAMASGASLRQALKTLPSAVGAAAAFPSRSAASPLGTARETLFVPSHLSPQEADTLSAELEALFAANRHTRDDASGLAVKVGRSTADVRTAAERLCVLGALSQTVSQGSVVFEGTRRGNA